MKKSVLIIDNNLNTCRELKCALEDEETEVYYTLSADEALHAFMKWSFCLVIIDIQLSEKNGREILKIIRKAKPVPIMALSTKADASERTAILQAGANACLRKPYHLNEVLAQARSLIDLYTTSSPLENQRYTIAFGTELVIDPTYWRVTLNGQQVDLTHKEFSLLYFLASHRNQVLSKEQIYNHVWNNDSGINVEATIKSHVKMLRQKLAPCGRNLIENIRGVGYRFVTDIEHSNIK